MGAFLLPKISFKAFKDLLKAFFVFYSTLHYFNIKIDFRVYFEPNTGI